MRRRAVILALALGMVFGFLWAAGSARAAYEGQTVQQTSITTHLNWHRVNMHSLPPVRRDTPAARTLSRIALAHAWRMAKAGRIFHEDISGKVPAGWKWLGQNVGMTSDPHLGTLFYAYHASPPHRAVMEYRYANRQGDAAVYYNGKWWHVWNFARY